MHHRKENMRGKAGFTLVELMVASAISVVLVATVYSVSLYQLNTFKTEQMKTKMHQSIRAGMDLLAMDVCMAGYGVPAEGADLDAWISWVPGMTENPHIVRGVGLMPDELYIAAAFDAPEATLAHPAGRGDVVIELDTSSANFNIWDRSVLYIGREEMARVVSVSHNRVTVSTDPLLNGQGLGRPYPAGTEVELVQVIRYMTDSLITPHLQREDSAKDYAFDWQKMVAGNVEDFQVSRYGDAINIELTGKIQSPDPNYTHPDTGDHYRRVTLSRMVTPRN
jgi:prepilin-type N-terminal cleavage/methylation domain-containing protein